MIKVTIKMTKNQNNRKIRKNETRNKSKIDWKTAIKCFDVYLWKGKIFWTIKSKRYNKKLKHFR